VAVKPQVAIDACLQTLHDSPLFAGASDQGLSELALKARCHTYPKNNVLFYQGDLAPSVYLVIDGQVRVSLTSEDGKEVGLNMIGPGHLVGLTSMLDRGTQPATVSTAYESHLAQFSRRDLREWYEGERAAERAMLLQLAQNLRRAYQRVGEHALMSVKDRLFSALLEIAEREGELQDEGEDLVFIRPTHQELADRIGSSREVVSRVLKQLLDSEMLRAEGRVIRVSQSALILHDEER
jgi:CRP/FNR family cyclic AMP-dependent transcriptional regulator